MRLLRLCAYFEPEKVSSSHLHDDEYQALADAGIYCTCIAPTPTRGIDKETRERYKRIKSEELYGGKVSVKRFSMYGEGRNPILRALRYLFCAIAEYHHGVRAEDIDAVYVGSTPPIQGALAATVAKKLSKKYKRKVPLIYNLQDIFPDSLVTSGMTKRESLLWKLGRKIEDYTYRNADKIIVISEGFRENILAKGVPENKVEVVYNWINMDTVMPVEKDDNKLYDEFGLSRDRFTVVYAGNFGAVQGAEVILDAAEILKEEDIQFAIFGGGARFKAASERAESMDNVFCHGLLPLERVSEVYSLGDVALITCKAGTGSSGMPSKTWSIMACNTPIIASFDEGSDLARAVEESGAGKCVTPGDAEALAEAIVSAKNSFSEKKDLRKWVSEKVSKDVCLPKKISVIKQFDRG